MRLAIALEGLATPLVEGAATPFEAVVPLVAGSLTSFLSIFEVSAPPGEHRVSDFSVPLAMASRIGLAQVAAGAAIELGHRRHQPEFPWACPSAIFIRSVDRRSPDRARACPFVLDDAAPGAPSIGCAVGRARCPTGRGRGQTGQTALMRWCRPAATSWRPSQPARNPLSQARCSELNGADSGMIETGHASTLAPEKGM